MRDIKQNDITNDISPSKTRHSIKNKFCQNVPVFQLSNFSHEKRFKNQIKGIGGSTVKIDILIDSEKFNLFTLRIFLRNVDILSYSKVTVIQRRQGFENIGKIPYKKNMAFFQYNFYARPQFENSTAHR